VLEPAFILLDEPFSGIDPLTVVDIQKIISDLSREGIGVLVTDHQVRETLSVTDRPTSSRAAKFSPLERRLISAVIPKSAECTSAIISGLN